MRDLVVGICYRPPDQEEQVEATGITISGSEWLSLDENQSDTIFSHISQVTYDIID